MAEAELYDESVVHEQLLLLQLQLEEGELSEEEYTEREAVLMERLREIRAYHEQRAREEAEVQGDDERPAARRVIVESQLEGGEQ